MNKTTGDFLVLNYSDRGNVPPITPAIAKRYEQFFVADGEKSAVVLGCNAGGMRATEETTRLTENLRAMGVSVMDVDPEKLPLPAGWGVGYQVYINPANAELSLRVGDKKHEVFPFGEFVPSASSQVERIEKICNFCRSAGNKTRPMTGYSFSDDEQLVSHVGYVEYCVSGFIESIPQTDDEVAILKAAFASKPSDKPGLIRLDETSSFPATMRAYAKNLSVVYDGVLELTKRDNNDPPVVKRIIGILAGKIRQCYERVQAIGIQEGFSDVAADASAKVNELRNSGGRGIAGSSSKPIPRLPSKPNE